MSQMLWIFFAILIVLALIGAVAYLLRRFAGRGIGSSNSRGRMPRLAVIDAAAVDGRRRLVLVRRDNVEHLLMIGGPSDIVVEPNIVRSSSPRDAASSRPPAGTELPPRIPLPDNNWSEPAAAEPFEFPEPHAAPPPPRPSRSSVSDDLRRAPSLAPERMRDDPLAGPALEPTIRPDPALRTERPSRPLPRSERLEPSLSRTPPRLDTTPARRAPEPTSAADQNLAEMAQRLEAALRRPGTRVEATTETRTVSVNSAERIGAPSVAPETPAPRPASLDAPEGAEPARPAFENLEDEMASLLGRPKNPT